MSRLPIRRALVSVFDKQGLDRLAAALAAGGVEVVSTGSTAAALEGHGLRVTRVESLTGFPEMLDGRVKTLHPRVHAGLLADRGRPEHLAELQAAGIAPFDLVVVNLYPFEETVASGDVDDALAVERIADVGVNTEFGELKPRQKDSGHVLERCPPERARRLRAEHLRADRTTLERWQGYLVVTVDDGVPVLVGEESEQLVGCATTPALQLVLERHLDLYLLRRNGLQDEDREWLRGDTVRRYLARHGELRRTVRLARYLVRPLAAPPTPDRRQRLDSLLEAAESPQQRAKRQLELSQDVEHWSYVIALAAYEGGRPQAVADAAGLLARRLAPGDPRGDTAWQPGEARARWLEQTGADRSGVVADEAGLLAQRLAPGDPRSGMAWHPGPPRAEWLERTGAELLTGRTEHSVMFNRTPVSRVQFKDPILRSAILDRVWNELDELRGPVRDWLDALGGDPNPEVHERTAEAVGYLASHGFGYVYDLVIVPWTRRSRTTRAAAALALGALARDERFTRQVLALLSQWVRWGDDAQRQTAAMAHGRAVGPRLPSTALRELRRLAMRDGMQGPVADELCELVRRWRHREVVEALGRVGLEQEDLNQVARLVRLTEKSRNPERMRPSASLPRNSGTIAPGWAASMACWAVGSVTSPIRSRVAQLPNLAAAFPTGPMILVNLHEPLRQLDRLVDRDLGRHVAAAELEDGQPEDVALHDGDPVEPPDDQQRRSPGVRDRDAQQHLLKFRQVVDEGHRSRHDDHAVEPELLDRLVQRVDPEVVHGTGVEREVGDADVVRRPVLVDPLGRRDHVAGPADAVVVHDIEVDQLRVRREALLGSTCLWQTQVPKSLARSVVAGRQPTHSVR